MPQTRKQTAPARLGRQTPTAAVVLPYTKTFGQDAIDLYNSTGRIAQQWQELLLYDILARNEEDLWVHTKFGYAVPRRNGKNEIAAIRELYGLQQGESILHTAHRTTTSRAAWERLCHLLDKAKIPYKSIQAVGREHIQLEEGEGRIEFRTRSSKGGLGEGFDLLVIDEAAVRLKAARQSLAEFAQATGGRVDSARISVPKFGRSEASRANWAAKDYEKQQKDAIIIENLRTAAKLPKAAVIHLEPTKINVDALTFDDAHINAEREHRVSEEQAKQYIRNAKISVSVWNGQFERYYGTEGAAYVNTIKHEIRTAYSRAEFDENTTALIEEMKKNGILG